MSNLAYEVGWQVLKDHMRNAGNVLRADVFIGNDGRSKGLGIVEYSKPYEVLGTFHNFETPLDGVLYLLSARRKVPVPVL